MGKLDEFVPTIRELNTDGHVSCLQPSLPHIMYVDALESSKLRIVVTDFKLSTWMTVKSVNQLEDMMINIGMGGSWSEFITFVTTSINSRDTKIVFEGQSIAGGHAYAKVVAEKYKWMPLVCFHLNKLVGGDAVDATEIVSHELFKLYKSQHELLVKEQKGRYQLTKSIAAEQEKNKILQRDLELIQRSESHKSQHMNERLTDDSLSMSTMQQTQDIHMIHSRGEKEVDTTLRLGIEEVFIPKSKHLSAKDVRIHSLENSLKKYMDAASSHQQHVAEIQKNAMDEIDLIKKENERLRMILYMAEDLAKKNDEAHATVLAQLQAKMDEPNLHLDLNNADGFSGGEGHRAGEKRARSKCG